MTRYAWAGAAAIVGIVGACGAPERTMRAAPDAGDAGTGLGGTGGASGAAGTGASPTGGASGSVAGGSGGTQDAALDALEEPCIPSSDKCANHADWKCGWLDDGCGAGEACGAGYVRDPSGGPMTKQQRDDYCSVVIGSCGPYAWGCGSADNWQTSSPGAPQPGPPPMVGCCWIGALNTPPDPSPFFWCCPKDTLPPH